MAAFNRLDSFDFVGIHEELPTTVELMKKRYNLKGECETQGETPEKYKAKISDSDYELAGKVCIADNVLYDLAKVKFEKTKIEGGMA